MRVRDAHAQSEQYLIYVQYQKIHVRHQKHS